MSPSLRTGVFVDAENVRYNGGYHMRYDVLRQFVSRGERAPARLNTYVAFDAERAAEDPEFSRKAHGYQQAARQFGWKVVTRQVRRFTDSAGNTVTRAGSRIDLAVDALTQGRQLDEVLLVTGDGDLVPLVCTLQDCGCRVEILGFDNVSRALQRQADGYHAGFLIPDLVPISYEPRNLWGEPGSCVRGLCSKWFPDKGYGFLRFLGHLSDQDWLCDPRLSGSPWRSVFCHINEVAGDINEDDLLGGDTVLEFYVQESPQEEGGLVAQNVRLVQE